MNGSKNTSLPIIIDPSNEIGIAGITIAATVPSPLPLTQSLTTPNGFTIRLRHNVNIITTTIESKTLCIYFASTSIVGRSNAITGDGMIECGGIPYKQIRQVDTRYDNELPTE
jgi:hypothetical protein